MNILIAEKDPFLRSLIASRLKARSYDVFETDTSDKALDRLKQETIHLILLSSEIERVNGRPLIEEIRKKPNMISVPIILLAREDQIRVLRAIRDLGEVPHPPGCRKLRGYEDVFRVRVGSFRVLYSVESARVLVIILKVGHRRDIYR